MDKTKTKLIISLIIIFGVGVVVFYLRSTPDYSSPRAKSNEDSSAKGDNGSREPSDPRSEKNEDSPRNNDEDRIPRATEDKGAGESFTPPSSTKKLSTPLPGGKKGSLGLGFELDLELDTGFDFKERPDIASFYHMYDPVDKFGIELLYHPTPQPVVDKMLKMAKVSKKDVVYDLGCGDGRIVITAARNYGAEGVGIDINPKRIRESEENAKINGVSDRVNFKLGSVFEEDLSKATVVMIYLFPDLVKKLEPILKTSLRPGTRVVCHEFHLYEWEHDKKVTIKNKGKAHNLFLYTVPKQKAD